MVLHSKIDNDGINKTLDNVYNTFITEYESELTTHKAIHHFVDKEKPHILNEIDKIRYGEFIRNTFKASNSIFIERIYK